MKKAFLLIVILLPLLACEDFFETNLEIDIPQPDKKLVVGALLQSEPGNSSNKKELITFSITVALDENPELVDMEDAEIWIEGPKDILRYVQSNSNQQNVFFYPERSFMPLPGQTYTLYGNKPGYDSISAVCTVPAGVPLKSWEYQYNGGIDQFGSERSAVTITFVDPSQEKNYYKASILLDNSTGSSNSAFSTYTSSLDRSVSPSADHNYVLIDDRTFNGEEKELTLQFYKNNSVDQVKRVYVIWKSITEAQYNYDKSLNQYEDNRYNPFSLPVDIKGNVKGGLGFFGIEHKITYQVK